MGLMDRFRSRARSPRQAGGSSSHPRRADAEHLRQFATSRRGVEGFVEPRTAVSDVTLILVAHDGEWTRRRVPSVEWAHTFANQHAVPSYDAAVVGYPARMREYNRRQKQSGTVPAPGPADEPGGRQPGRPDDGRPDDGAPTV
ncbi:MAG: hypothetical protein WB798_06745 [Nocardioidaceae bacterium]